jgi:hypothetical protein
MPDGSNRVSSLRLDRALYRSGAGKNPVTFLLSREPYDGDTVLEGIAMIRTALITSALLMLSACDFTPSQSTAQGGGILTIHGEIGVVDRGPMDPVTEPLFANLGISFDDACVLTFSSLAAREQYTVRVDFPAGDAVRSFSGPLLRDALSIAQMNGDSLIVTALDGYQREISIDRIEAHDVILALRINGDALPVGGLGPSVLVWPRRSDPALAGMNDEDWVWGVISVEVFTAPAG